MTALDAIVSAILPRWALWGLLAQLVGAVLIAYGFRVSPDSGARYIDPDGRVFPHLILRVHRRWAYRLGWFLVIVGVGLEMVPEVLAVVRAAQ
jgi:hypothetical protein